MALLSPNFDISVEIGTGATPTYNSMDAWVNSITFSHNETTNVYYPLGNNGVGFNSTTGINPVMTCSGKRMVGDASQTAILAMQYSLGASRKCTLKFIVPTSESAGVVTKTTYTVAANVQNITPFGGEGNADGDFSVDFAFDGVPQSAT